MQYSAVLLAGFAALVSAQTYTGPGVTPTASAPAGCQTSYSGTFGLSVVNTTTASKVKRESGQPNALVIALKNSVLTDTQGRIGYIASNYQFQFDFGGQAGELASAGFSVCANNSLALGSSAIWYECLSGNFYNLYDKNWAPQCQAVYLEILPMSASTSTAVGTATTGSASATTSASAVTSSVAAASSITDGQVQGGSTSAVTSSVQVVSSVSVKTSSAAVVTSISDHQIQGATSTSAIVSSTTLMSTVTPATTKSVAVVSSISDHQIQAPTSTSVAAYTGAAAMPTVAAQLILAAAGAAAALL